VSDAAPGTVDAATGEPPFRGLPEPSKSGVVEVYLRHVDQLFDSMDPSPFHEKALDRAAEEYIVASAKELPSGAPAALVIHLEGRSTAPLERQALADAIHKHFARNVQLLGWELHRLIRRGIISFIIGLTVLAAALAAGEAILHWFGRGHLPRVIGESLHVGGWVAMWTPMEIFLYDWWPILRERRLYERLAQMPVHVVDSASPPVRAI
jgi:hypothetical protein